MLQVYLKFSSCSSLVNLRRSDRLAHDLWVRASVRWFSVVGGPRGAVELPGACQSTRILTLPPKKDVLGSWLAFRPSDTANGPHFVPGAVRGVYTSRVPRRTVAALAFRIRQPDSWCLTVETAPLPSQGNGVVCAG